VEETNTAQEGKIGSESEPVRTGIIYREAKNKTVAYVELGRADRWLAVRLR
jgi:hypothetical protein